MYVNTYIARIIVLCLVFLSIMPQGNLITSASDDVTDHESDQALTVFNQSDDYEYTVNPDGTATITKYSGREGDIRVPNVLDGLSVTRIGREAFSGVLLLITVSIPESITHIGASAFNPNMTLQRVTIHSPIVVIEADAFPISPRLTIVSHDPSTAKEHANQYNQTFEPFQEEVEAIFEITDQGVITAYNGPSGDVVIPEMIDGIEVSEVAERVFYQKGLTGLVLPETIVTIGRDAFRDNQLTSLVIPGSVRSLGNTAFYQNRLTSLTIEEGLTTIGEHAFALNQLESIEFPSSVTRIEDNAFLQNRFLSIEIPAQITHIGTGAFAVSDARYVAVHNPTAYIGDVALENGRYGMPSVVIIGHESSTARDYTEANNLIFKEIQTAPELKYQWVINENKSVTITNYLGQDKIVEVPNEIIRLPVAGIRADAFKTELEAIYLFDQTIQIDAGAFSGNASNPGALVVVGHEHSTAKDYAASFNHSFDHILTRVPERFFDWSDHGDGTGAITNYFVEISDRVVPNDLVLPDVLGGVTITEISRSVFSGKGISKVTLPADLKVIDDYAFHWNDLTEVVIPDGVISIGENAFNSNQLAEIVIPESVTEIKRNAFNNNQATPADFLIVGAVGSIAEAYAAEYGFSFQDIDEFQFEWTDNGDGTASVTAYHGVNSDVVIPNRLGGLMVTEIGSHAFSNRSLTAISLPDTVERIGEGAFSNNLLMRVVIPATVTEIGREAFSSNQLDQIEIWNETVTIGRGAFDQNQADPADLLLLGYGSSTAKTHADEFGFSFSHDTSEVVWSPNGSEAWAQSYATTIDVSGFLDGAPLQYTWSTGEVPPNDGWTDFVSGEAIDSPIETGEFYLHVRGTSLFEAEVGHRSDGFKLDNTAPSVTITPSTIEKTHDDVELSVLGSDFESGIKRIKDPGGAWHEGDVVNYFVKENGTYSFIVEDIVGNQTTESIEVDNIDKTISFQVPTISPFGLIQLTGQSTVHTTGIGNLSVNDWRDGENNWRVEVSASRLQLANGTHQLPSGSLRLKPLSGIDQLEGSGDFPVIIHSDTQVIDSGNIIIAEASGARGSYALMFPAEALELLIDPTTVLIENASEATYETTIKFELITAP